VGAASSRQPQTLLALAGDAPMSSEGVGAGAALFCRRTFAAAAVLQEDRVVVTIEVVKALQVTLSERSPVFVTGVEIYLETETTTTLVLVEVEVEVTVTIGADVMIGVVTDVDVTVVRRMELQYVEAAEGELCANAAIRL